MPQSFTVCGLRTDPDKTSHGPSSDVHRACSGSRKCFGFKFFSNSKHVARKVSYGENNSDFFLAVIDSSRGTTEIGGTRLRTIVQRNVAELCDPNNLHYQEGIMEIDIDF